MKLIDKDLNRVELNFMRNKLEISVDTSKSGGREKIAELDVEYENNFIIAFNVNYILEFLKVLPKKTKKVSAQFINSSYQTLWQSDSSDFEEIIMPMKIM